jgi:short-subunit dehydrogenase
MISKLQGSVVCITGGARGIGRATAQLLARQGAIVWIGDLDSKLAENTAAELGHNVRSHHLDVSDQNSFFRFLEAASADGPVAVLINNAGIWRVGDFLEQPVDGILREISVNLNGTILGMRLALPSMIERNCGHIINVASMAGKISLPGGAIYSASKFGVAALSRAVRAELPTSDVSISTVFPATVATDLQTGISLEKANAMQPDDVAKAILSCIKSGAYELTIPRSHNLFGAIEALAPQRLFDSVKRRITIDTLYEIDHEKRREYYASRGEK